MVVLCARGLKTCTTDVMYLKLIASLYFCRLNVFTRSDIIAILFCSTHKSLTLGMA